MAYEPPYIPSPRASILFSIIISFVLLFPSATATLKTIFNFTSFPDDNNSIRTEGNTFFRDQIIQLTRDTADGSLTSSYGRAVYNIPIQLWDAKTGVVADFTTNFEFTIIPFDNKTYGDGLAFFMAPLDSHLPMGSTGGWLGLFNSTTDTSTNSSSSTKIFAVEFDTYKNTFDPDENHVGIDVNSRVSVSNTSLNTNLKSGNKTSAWISYNSTTNDLSVYVSGKNQSSSGVPTLSFNLELKTLLPEKVIVGFSASTGAAIELHQIHSWDFVSTTFDKGKSKKMITLVVVVVGEVAFLIIMAGLGCAFILQRKLKKRQQQGNEDVTAMDASMDENFAKGTGPRRFTYKELLQATNNFSDEGKLGQGGFGGVYKGVLSDRATNDEMVAVKKISKGSTQGKKEYMSEVTVISRLRHRNLVKLNGWCHENGEFLLVYEYMPNGSLDFHLFGKGNPLTWVLRYKIALGLASALLYLHEEWEQCVVHRDIKASNVMLDSSFNAKLGDFGLARFVDHELGSQTTVLAGTMGYLAPECVTTGKASKESDVYSFGVVSLEIACGRKAVEPKLEEFKIRLVEWVWDLYGMGRLLEAADERMSNEFDEQQMEHLLIVGLWCAHPDHNIRPSIRQAIQVLNFEAPLPSLPQKMPVPMYCMPPIRLSSFSNSAIDGMTHCVKDQTRCSCQNCCNSSTVSSGDSTTKPLLKTDESPHHFISIDL